MSIALTAVVLFAVFFFLLALSVPISVSGLPHLNFLGGCVK